MTDVAAKDEARAEHYRFTNDWTMEREPRAPFYWVLRDHQGVQIDRDQYRHDVIPRHALVVAQHYDPTAIRRLSQEAGE